MELNIGDMVRIRDDLEVGRCYGNTNIYFCDEMEQFKGQIVEVILIDENGEFLIKEDCGYYFSIDMIEEIVESKESNIFNDDEVEILIDCLEYKEEKIVTEIMKLEREHKKILDLLNKLRGM